MCDLRTLVWFIFEKSHEVKKFCRRVFVREKADIWKSARKHLRLNVIRAVFICMSHLYFTRFYLDFNNVLFFKLQNGNSKKNRILSNSLKGIVYKNYFKKKWIKNGNYFKKKWKETKKRKIIYIVCKVLLFLKLKIEIIFRNVITRLIGCILKHHLFFFHERQWCIKSYVWEEAIVCDSRILKEMFTRTFQLKKKTTTKFCKTEFREKLDRHTEF